MSYEVEAGVPIPAPAQVRAKYPFYRMNVGDSFLFDANDRQKVDKAAREYARRRDQHFVTREVKETDGAGRKCRCWRTV